MGILEFVREDTVVWTAHRCVEEVVKRKCTVSAVKVLGRDGWPSYYSRDTLLIRIANTPPSVPVSMFARGELVLSTKQVNALLMEVKDNDACSA